MKRHIHIVGAGLIGTSIGLKVIELGYSVSMTDVNPEAEGLSNALMGRWSKEGESADFVVVAVPPKGIAGVIKDQLSLHPNAIVLETSSTKTNLALELKALSVDTNRVVLTHPISGREVNGPSAARADLFLNRAWIVSPLDQTSENAVAEVEGLIKLMGADPYRLSFEDHDHLLATTSHLPQVLSTVLATRINEWGAKASLSGQGLRDLTRLADSDPNLWLEILSTNKEQVSKVLTNLIADLEKFNTAIRDDDSATILNIFNEGKIGRSLISGKHGAVARDYAQCQIVIPDQPGALAKVFEICNRDSINIEDISLEHSPAQETGLLTLSINPQQTRLLEQSLQNLGFVYYFKEKR